MGKESDLPSHFHLRFFSLHLRCLPHTQTAPPPPHTYSDSHTHSICFSPFFFFLSWSRTGPLAAWPVFQVHSPGDLGPHQGGIPVPPGAVSQVHAPSNTARVTHASYVHRGLSGMKFNSSNSHGGLELAGLDAPCGSADKCR